LCNGTLQDYVEGTYHGPKFKEEREMLQQLTEGVTHLHKNSIVHGDIKPTNILIYLADDGGWPQIKLNIPSIEKMLKTGKEDFSNTSVTNLIGTIEWMAPEMYELQRVDSKVDIWALGCVFAYTLSGGKHPFGDDLYERIYRIRTKQHMLLTVEDLKIPYCDDRLAFELIQWLLLLHMLYTDIISENPKTSIVLTTEASVLEKVDDHLSYYSSNSKEHCIGKGSFAYVFLGLWRDPLGGSDAKEKKVAVKRIQRDPNQQSNFLKEVGHFLKVRHPNILQFFDAKMDYNFL